MQGKSLLDEVGPGNELLDYEPEPFDDMLLDLKDVSEGEFTDPKSQQAARVVVEQEGKKMGKIHADLIKEFPTVFSEKLKVMKGEPFHIELKPGAEPKRKKYPREMGLALKPKLFRELEELTRQGLISKVNWWIEWVSPIVFVPRKGSDRVRMCIDFTKLNKAVNREFYYSPSPQVSVCDIPRAQVKYFSKLDCQLGYHQVPLDEASKDLMTFITVYGKYRFERAPFGMCSIAEVFNRKMEEHLGTYRHGNERRATDDCLLFDRSLEAHVEHIRDFLTRCKEANITIAPDKFEFGKRKVTFAGYEVSQADYRPAHDLVGPLRNFTKPETLTDLHAFLGLAQQFGKVAPRLAEVTEPMRHLLKKPVTKGKKLEWGEEEEKAFEATKRYLRNARLLEFFYYKLLTRLVSDASRTGVGYVLQQKHSNYWKPVTCRSRYLTRAEGNYAVIELELLGMVYAVLRCKMFLLGLNDFTIVTDHHPLVPILNKQTLDEVANPRLHRLKTKLCAFNGTAVWLCGKDNLISDYLSRNPYDRVPDHELEV